MATAIRPLVPQADDATTPLHRSGWMMIGCIPGNPQVSRISLTKFPFSIGRLAENDLELSSRNVSKRHAEILATMGAVLVRDLGSTNGTFVNGVRIHNPTPIGEGDLLQFADTEFRMTHNTQEVSERTFEADGFEQSWLISRMHEVLNEDAITMLFQPIFAGSTLARFSVEALVRCDLPGLESPLKLFDAAERLGLEAELSQKCRMLAVELLDQADLPLTLFVNTHPHEALDDELIENLKILRSRAGTRPLVLEIHEQSITDRTTLRGFVEQLSRLDIQIAYDDFGVGQSRLIELAEFPPDYVKFDRSLLKDLGTSRAVHTSLVRTLHQHAHDLGVATIAEGIDTPEAAAACREMGFNHYQGFLFAKPETAQRLKRRLDILNHRNA